MEFTAAAGGARVLVVGAGPVGLVAALMCRHADIDVDIIDANTEPVSQSRATDLHPNTLERLAAYGVTGDLVAIGQVVRAVVVHTRRGTAGTVPLGRHGSPYPHALTVPQCTTEGLLQDHLARCGTKVERGTRLTELTSHPNHTDVQLQMSTAAIDAGVGGDRGRIETRRYDWVIACDGAGSTVRHALDIGYPGRTTPYVSAIADLELELPFRRDEIHIMLRLGGGVHVLPMPIDGYVRVLLDRWNGPAGERADPDEFVDVLSERLGLSGLDCTNTRWTSTFEMHRRTADRFRHQRVVLAGDAAHICPPIGGQGLNTGIADVADIIPVLADIIRGRTEERALDELLGRRRRTALRTGRAAWCATGINSVNRRALAHARDGFAPIGLAVVRTPINRWLAGALEP